MKWLVTCNRIKYLFKIDFEKTAISLCLLSWLRKFGLLRQSERHALTLRLMQNIVSGIVFAITILSVRRLGGIKMNNVIEKYMITALEISQIRITLIHI